MQTAYNCNHRQIVFTIPESLRIYFFKDYEKMINILFKSVSETLYSILREYFKRNKKGVLKKYKSKIKYTPRFFAFLHTFGRDLKWNPHIHVLIAEIKLGENNSCQPWKFLFMTPFLVAFKKYYLNICQNS